jgi:hypothetical protein
MFTMADGSISFVDALPTSFTEITCSPARIMRFNSAKVSIVTTPRAVVIVKDISFAIVDRLNVDTMLLGKGGMQLSI